MAVLGGDCVLNVCAVGTVASRAADIALMRVQSIDLVDEQVHHRLKASRLRSLARRQDKAVQSRRRYECGRFTKFTMKFADQFGCEHA